MLFVPSVEQGTLVERGDELARFIRRDSGLILRSEVPTSYAAVIQALGSGQADVAWMPAFAYVIAHARYGARGQVAGGSVAGEIRGRGDSRRDGRADSAVRAGWKAGGVSALAAPRVGGWAALQVDCGGSRLGGGAGRRGR